MDKSAAQRRMYLLSETFGSLQDQVIHTIEKQDSLNEERRQLLSLYPTLDIRRPSQIEGLYDQPVERIQLDTKG